MASGQSRDAIVTGERPIGGRDIELGSSYDDRLDVDIDKWAGSLAKILEDVPQYMCRAGHPGRVSRIPENLREIEPKAYEPCFLSIGPYHHGKPKVQSMETTKQFVLKYILEVKPELTLNDYLKEIKSIEPEARSFYSDIEMESEKFVQMLLIDSMYILTIFGGIVTSQEKARIEDTLDNKHMTAESDDSNSHTSSEEEDNTARLFSASFHHDLFLLENQLPFFVLERLHSLVNGDSPTQLVSIVKDKVATLLVAYTKQDLEMVNSPTTEVHHLLHLCHMFFHPTVRQESTSYQFPESRRMFRLGSAVQLYEAGVSFLARSGSDQHSLLDITFSSGKLVMPCLLFDHNTSSLLRNLIAFEQMKYPSMGLNVSAYAVLLLHLVTTPEDAQLLRRKEVIQHHLGSDKEMMHFVNKLSVGLSFDYVEDVYSLKSVFQELNRYSEHRVPRWRAWLKHKYCHNPWTVVSLVAASVLLILSIVETFFTVYSYYHPYFNSHS